MDLDRRDARIQALKSAAGLLEAFLLACQDAPVAVDRPFPFMPTTGIVVADGPGRAEARSR
jgi:hypothetical protein